MPSVTSLAALRSLTISTPLIPSPPSLEDFLSCLRDKSANTAGGHTGLDYRSLQAWPVPIMKHKAYEILSGFWSHKTLAS